MKFTFKNVLLFLLPLIIASLIILSFVLESLVPCIPIGLALLWVLGTALVNDFGDK